MLRAAGARVARTAELASASIRPSGSRLPEVEVPGDFSSAAPFIVAATLLPGSRAHDPRRRPQPAAHRAARRARADGRARSAILTRRTRRRASRSATSRCARAELVATTIQRRGGAAARRRAAALRAARRAARAATSCVHGAEELRAQGDRPDRGRRRRAARDRRARRGPRRTASRSAASRPGRAAARSTRAATTASRCSARSPGSSRARACELEGAESVAISFPGFFDRPRSEPDDRTSQR